MVEVTDYCRTGWPYHAVGKLQFTKAEEYSAATAFAVNVKGAKNIIFTAACNVYDIKGRANSIEFIPAMKNDGSQPFGSFKQIIGGNGVAWFVHPNWDPITKPHKYNLGAIKLGKNKKGKDIGDVITMLDVNFDVPVSKATKWKTFWYNNLTMFQSDITFSKLTNNNNNSSIRSTHDTALVIPSEAIGAPWINSNEVNGHYIAHTYDNDAAIISPYYDLGLIREVLNQM